MRVTSKGQVTIPQPIREAMGIRPPCEVRFVKGEDGRYYLEKMPRARGKSRFRLAHRAAPLTLTTDEIMALTRSED